MPVSCQTHDLWKALMKYKQFQVGHSIKLLMVCFHCSESGGYWIEFLMGENFRLNYVVIMNSGKGLAYKRVYVLTVCVGYKTSTIASSSHRMQDALDSSPSFDYRIWNVSSPHLQFPPQPMKTLELLTSKRDNV